MIPILKKGKDPKQAASYHPISQLCWENYGESCQPTTHVVPGDKQPLAPELAGFRQFRATEDQTTYLAQEIEDAFQDKKVTRVAWIDLQRAGCGLMGSSSS